MVAEFGEEYLAYARLVPGFIPRSNKNKGVPRTQGGTDQPQ